MTTQYPEALRLAGEYRKTMPSEVLHLWATDAQAELRRLSTVEQQRDKLLEMLTKITERIEDHPAYQAMTEEEENLTGGDAAELSYLARIGRAAISEVKGEKA